MEEEESEVKTEAVGLKRGVPVRESGGERVGNGGVPDVEKDSEGEEERDGSFGEEEGVKKVEDERLSLRGDGEGDGVLG